MNSNTLRWLAAVGLVVYAFGCGDGTGPPSVEPLAEVRTDAQMHMLRQPVVPAEVPGQYGVQFELGVQPKPLETYTAGFWAVRGERRVLSIRYTDGAAFLTFTVPELSLAARPDGTPFAISDSVRITATVDQSLLLVSLEPSGLTFSAGDPAVLDLRYADADPDYDGDGDVDADDNDIELDLRMWVQEGNGALWSVNEADHDLQAQRFLGYLYHFSNYTVSW